jgi:Bacterial protein of unknown function (DUF853)
MKTDRDGRGADKLMQSPRLYATFLLWMLSELFEELPEAGDPSCPGPRDVRDGHADDWFPHWEHSRHCGSRCPDRSGRKLPMCDIECASQQSRTASVISARRRQPPLFDHLVGRGPTSCDLCCSAGDLL